VALSPDGKQLVTGSLEKSATLWDAAGRKLQTFQGHTGYVVGVAMSDDGKHIVTGSHDQTAILWRTVDGKKVRTLSRRNDRQGMVLDGV
jgi:WD40 repeat protein